MKTGLVWLIGKPGSGKTTVGEYIAEQNDGIEYYSFSSLLKKFQENIGPEGFFQETREKAYDLLREISNTKLVIVSGNPYTKATFLDMKRITERLDVVYLDAPDELVMERLTLRNRDVLVHDGASQKERLEKFNENVIPLINEILNQIGTAIQVEGKTKEQVAGEVISVVLN